MSDQSRHVLVANPPASRSGPAYNRLESLRRLTVSSAALSAAVRQADVVKFENAWHGLNAVDAGLTLPRLETLRFSGSLDFGITLRALAVIAPNVTALENLSKIDDIYNAAGDICEPQSLPRAAAGAMAVAPAVARRKRPRSPAFANLQSVTLSTWCVLTAACLRLATDRNACERVLGRDACACLCRWQAGSPTTRPALRLALAALLPPDVLLLESPAIVTQATVHVHVARLTLREPNEMAGTWRATQASLNGDDEQWPSVMLSPPTLRVPALPPCASCGRLSHRLLAQINCQSSPQLQHLGPHLARIDVCLCCGLQRAHVLDLRCERVRNLCIEHGLCTHSLVVCGHELCDMHFYTDPGTAGKPVKWSIAQV